MNIALGDAGSNWDYERILNRIGMFNQGLGRSKPARLKLCDWKLYFDSCATNHLVFADWCLNSIHKVKAYLKGHCNTGVPICNKQGYYRVFKMWLNRNGTANLLSIPQLEQDSYIIDYNTARNWVVRTP